MPFDLKVGGQAAMVGTPLAEAGKSSRTAAPLCDLAHALVVACDGAGDAPAAAGGKAPRKGGKPAGQSLMGKFGELKGLMPRRAKK